MEILKQRIGDLLQEASHDVTWSLCTYPFGIAIEFSDGFSAYLIKDDTKIEENIDFFLRLNLRRGKVISAIRCYCDIHGLNLKTSKSGRSEMIRNDVTYRLHLGYSLTDLLRHFSSEEEVLAGLLPKINDLVTFETIGRYFSCPPGDELAIPYENLPSDVVRPFAAGVAQLNEVTTPICEMAVAAENDVSATDKISISRRGIANNFTLNFTSGDYSDHEVEVISREKINDIKRQLAHGSEVFSLYSRFDPYLYDSGRDTWMTEEEWNLLAITSWEKAPSEAAGMILAMNGDYRAAQYIQELIDSSDGHLYHDGNVSVLGLFGDSITCKTRFLEGGDYLDDSNESYYLKALGRAPFEQADSRARVVREALAMLENSPHVGDVDDYMENLLADLRLMHSEDIRTFLSSKELADVRQITERIILTEPAHGHLSTFALEVACEMQLKEALDKMTQELWFDKVIFPLSEDLVDTNSLLRISLACNNQKVKDLAAYMLLLNPADSFQPSISRKARLRKKISEFWVREAKWHAAIIWERCKMT